MFPVAVINERDSHGPRVFIDCLWSKMDVYLTSQSGTEITYRVQERMSGKGSLLAKSSGPLGTLIAWRTLF